jgi:hypothetical protein
MHRWLGTVIVADSVVVSPPSSDIGRCFHKPSQGITACQLTGFTSRWTMPMPCSRFRLTKTLRMIALTTAASRFSLSFGLQCPMSHFRLLLLHRGIVKCRWQCLVQDLAAGHSADLYGVVRCAAANSMVASQ